MESRNCSHCKMQRYIAAQVSTDGSHTTTRKLVVVWGEATVVRVILVDPVVL